MDELVSEETRETIKNNLKECPRCEGKGTENLYRNQPEGVIGYCATECSRCYGLGRVCPDVNQFKVLFVVKQDDLLNEDESH